MHREAADLSRKIGSLSFNQEESKRLIALLAQKETEITVLKENASTQEQMMKDTNDQINKLSHTSKDLQIKVTGKPLIREIKERVWDGISILIAPRWDCLTLLQEQIDMTKRVSLEIRELQGIIKDSPSKAQALIEYVNTLSMEALVAKRIERRTYTVILAQKWLTKHHLTLTAQAKNATGGKGYRERSGGF